MDTAIHLTILNQFFGKKLERSRSLPIKLTDLKETHEYPRCNRFYPLESFPHFQYVYSLAYDCYCRLKEADVLGPDELAACSLKQEPEVVIKIGFIGNLMEESLKCVSKVKGNEEENGKTVWPISPLICFQKDVKISDLKACHKLFVNKDEDEIEIVMDSHIHVVEYDEEKLRKAISICIEKGLVDYLERSMNVIKNSEHGSREDLRDFYLEMKSIIKHVLVEKSTQQHASMPTGIDYGSIPSEIKDLLLREPNVNSFGIWEDATFKIFMDETVDVAILIEKLKSKNERFFKRFEVQVEKKKFTTKIATQLKQGGELHKHTASEKGVECGTLGGFVKDTTTAGNCSDAYALTCNHLYPTLNEPAYANIDGEEKEVGKCIFTTREKSCDFAVVEISKEFYDKCDFKFRRDDEKTCNAEVSEFFPINVGIVHKNGSKTKWTHGRVVSLAFYDKLNQREIFVVKGLGRPFSTPGDSGSIVFARDNSVSQNAVDILGMVYSNHPEIRDDISHPEKEKLDEASGYSETNLKKGDKSYSTAVGKTRGDQLREKIMKNPENYSFCFRMNNAFELLKKEKNLVVSFERVENTDKRDEDCFANLTKSTNL
ncbi:uncharacterized protein LOC134246962 [Saccostrea cucullata]|uniref:uncharacterized protein LOC134246962 n=1 Tax=Saccostrea cuccullata TaxID=36930 RepID=UPI002ED5ACB9